MTNVQPILLGDAHGADPMLYDLLPGDAPSDGRRYLRNVDVPTLTPYLPEPGNTTGSAVVVAPGGALHFLSIDNEGTWVAEALARRGVAAFVLHYRVEPTPRPEPEYAAYHMRHLSLSVEAREDRGFLAEISKRRREPAVEDGGRAVRYVREHAAEYGIDPDRVGMLGFSAGGFLTIVTTLDAPERDRPNFIAPIYPALWDHPIDVPTPTPPMFLAWAEDDPLGDVIIGASMDVWAAWRRTGGSAEAHAYAGGGHGFGFGRLEAPSDRWLDDFMAWHAYVVR